MATASLKAITLVKTKTEHLWPLSSGIYFDEVLVIHTHTTIFLLVKGKSVKANALSIPLAVESVP